MKSRFTAVALVAAFSDVGACTLDLMTVYTPAAVAGAGGETALIAQIATSINQINTAFSNSGLPHSVASSNIYYARNGDSWGATVDEVLVNGSVDGQVRAQRNATRSDAVIFVIGNSSGLLGRTIPDAEKDPYFAFAAVQQAGMSTGTNGIFPGYSFAHEFGHIMGLRHQWSGGVVGDQSSGYPLGHGMWLRADATTGMNCTHTLMAYPSLLSVNNIPCIGGADNRRLFFANPAVANFLYVNSGTVTIYNRIGSSFTATAPASIASGNSVHSDEASVINSKLPGMCNFGLTRLRNPQAGSLVMTLSTSVLADQ